MVHCNQKTKQLETYMQNYNLHFLVDKTNSMHKSLIDHVWANLANIKYRIFVLDTYWSDHDTDAGASPTHQASQHIKRRSAG
jgi:hypothetical protein